MGSSSGFCVSTVSQDRGPKCLRYLLASRRDYGNDRRYTRSGFLHQHADGDIGGWQPHAFQYAGQPLSAPRRHHESARILAGFADADWTGRRGEPAVLPLGLHATVEFRFQQDLAETCYSKLLIPEARVSGCRRDGRPRSIRLPDQYLSQGSRCCSRFPTRFSGWFRPETWRRRQFRAASYSVRFRISVLVRRGRSGRPFELPLVRRAIEEAICPRPGGILLYVSKAIGNTETRAIFWMASRPTPTDSRISIIAGSTARSWPTTFRSGLVVNYSLELPFGKGQHF